MIRITFLTVDIQEASIQKTFKAPQRYLYEIKSITYTSFIPPPIAGNIVILDYGNREIVDFTDIGLVGASIYIFPSITNLFEQILVDNFKTKYITVASSDSLTGGAHITINVDIVKASKKDLIFEYLRKSR